MSREMKPGAMESAQIASDIDSRTMHVVADLAFMIEVSCCYKVVSEPKSSRCTLIN